MMPSGNDAAVVIAENFGLLVEFKNLKKKKKGFSDDKEFRTLTL